MSPSNEARGQDRSNCCAAAKENCKTCYEKSYEAFDKDFCRTSYKREVENQILLDHSVGPSRANLACLSSVCAGLIADRPDGTKCSMPHQTAK